MQEIVFQSFYKTNIIQGACPQKLVTALSSLTELLLSLVYIRYQVGLFQLFFFSKLTV